MSKEITDMETMFTTTSGLPVGARVFEVMNCHEEEPTPSPEHLALLYRGISASTSPETCRICSGEGIIWR